MTRDKKAKSFGIEEITKRNELIKRVKPMRRRDRVGAFALPSAAHKFLFLGVCSRLSKSTKMNSFKECCDNSCCAQGGSDNFGGFGGSSFRPRRSFSFYRDQCQDVPPSGFRNVGTFFHPSGNIRGTVYANLNGDIVGKLSGKIEGLPGLLGCVGNFGNLGNMGLSLPFSVQFGDRTL